MIVIKNLSKTIYGKNLFSSLDLSFASGEKVGIIGPNGSGKSTLLAIIAGLTNSDTGRVQTETERIGLLPQHICSESNVTISEYLQLQMASGGWTWLGKLGLGELDTEASLRTLSGGQQTRLALVKALTASPSFILMDEPTNNLDYEGVEWLESFIKKFRGGIIIVSHDRAFLNTTVSRIIEFDPANKHIRSYQGNYDSYLIEHKKCQEILQKDYEEHQKEKQRLEQWLVLKRQEASIYKDPAKGRQVRQMEKRIQREIYDKSIPKPLVNKSLSGMRMSGETHSDKLILRLKSIGKSFSDHTLFSEVSFEVDGAERVHIFGANGSGKSTLLKIILGEISADTGTVQIGENIVMNYFSQEQGVLGLERTVIDEFLSAASISYQEARSILGSFLFCGDDIFKRIKNLSYGERVRIMFAKFLQKQSQLLILDEPTNHLDIASREVIEEALKNYRGAILIVSHDRYFLHKLIPYRTIALQGGTARELWL